MHRSTGNTESSQASEVKDGVLSQPGYFIALLHKMIRDELEAKSRSQTRKPILEFGVVSSWLFNCWQVAYLLNGSLFSSYFPN